MPKRETSRGFSYSQPEALVLNNSTTESDIFSAVIGAGKMGTNKSIDLTIRCTLTTPLTLVPVGTIKVKFGSSTLTIFDGVAIASLQNNTPFKINVYIRNKTATSQIVFAEIDQVANNVPMALTSDRSVYGEWSEDTTVDKTLAVTGKFGSLSANTFLNVRDVVLDVS